MRAKEVFSKSEMIALFQVHNSYSAVAKIMGCSRELVRQKLSKMGYSNVFKVRNDLSRKKDEDFFHCYKNSSKKELTDKGIAPRSELRRIEDKLKKRFRDGRMKHSDEHIIEVYGRAFGIYYRMAKILDMAYPSLKRLMNERGLFQKYPPQGKKKNLHILKT